MKNSTPLLEWHAYIHPHYERGKMWFLCAVALIAILFSYSIYTEAWSFSVIIVMSVALYWFMHRHAPKERHIALYDWGFVLDEKEVQWEDCTGYWFLEGPGYHQLHIEHTKRVVGDFVIQTANIHPEEIHKVLDRFLNQMEDKQERLLDTISRICKI